jgi:hypothetical protein
MITRRCTILPTFLVAMFFVPVSPTWAQSSTPDEQLAAARADGRFAATRTQRLGWTASGMALGLPIGVGTSFIRKGRGSESPGRLARRAGVAFGLVVVLAAVRNPSPSAERDAWAGTPETLRAFDASYRTQTRKRRVAATILGGVAAGALGYFAFGPLFSAAYATQ